MVDISEQSESQIVMAIDQIKNRIGRSARF